ncbi:MAG: Gfo/Idh/MocA family protein [Phycisphaerae bacterium]
MSKKPSKKLKLGAVGIGGCWNWGHAEPLLAHPDVEITAVCDIVKAKAEKFAAAHGIKRVFTDYREMVKLDELDMVDVCTPNILHSEIAVAALGAGKHVLTEKPDAVNVAEAQKMADAASKNKRVLMVMRNNRFNPSVQFMRRYIAAGHMGEVYTGRCGWIRRRGIPGKGGWFTNKAMSGGGPLIDLGVHYIDVAMWLMGNPRPVSVTGMTYQKFAHTSVSDSVHSQFGEKKDEGVIDVEDLASGFIRFANGASLQIEFSWASNIDTETHFAELRGTKSGCSLTGERELKLFTEIEGTLCDISPRLAKPALSTHGQYLAHWIDCVLGRAEPIWTTRQGVDMIKILCAIYESAASGSEVKL